jgi:dTDP-4-amino-4,6-dideoxygalactose transaminase
LAPTNDASQVPLSRVVADDEIKRRVMAAVESGQYILGPECKAFEKELAAYFGRRHCVLVSNATSGLTLALLALGIGGEVIVPSHTAFPTIEGIFDAGATPVFADVDDTATIDPSAIERLVTPRTKAIVPVHIYGQACDMDAVLGAARRHGLRVVEDCAQAHGAQFGGKKVGSFGDAAVLSFYPSKNLPVLGDGGAVLTDDDRAAERLRMLRDHGRRDKHVHEIVAWNMRFNDIQAATGRVNLARLDANNAARRRIAAAYDDAFAGLPLGLPRERPGSQHVYHLYVVRTPRRDALAKHLAAAGIQTGIHYPLPTHRQPGTLERTGGKHADLPRTDALCAEILSLPVFPSLTDDEQRRVIDATLAFFRG